MSLLGSIWLTVWIKYSHSRATSALYLLTSSTAGSLYCDELLPRGIRGKSQVNSSGALRTQYICAFIVGNSPYPSSHQSSPNTSLSTEKVSRLTGAS